HREYAPVHRRQLQRSDDGQVAARCGRRREVGQPGVGPGAGRSPVASHRTRGSASAGDHFTEGCTRTCARDRRFSYSRVAHGSSRVGNKSGTGPRLDLSPASLSTMRTPNSQWILISTIDVTIIKMAPTKMTCARAGHPFSDVNGMLKMKPN